MSNTQTTTRPIRKIAQEIKADWSQIGKGVSPHAKPYLDAMLTLNSIEDNYFMDSGKSIVLYFLSNAQHYRGDTARKLKAELKSMV